MIRSLLILIQTPGATHVAVAFDHVIEFFRNKKYAGCKSREGVGPIILNQKETLADLKWQGAYPRLKKLCLELALNVSLNE